VTRQRRNAILGEAFVAQTVKLAFARNTRQLSFEFLEIQGHAFIRLQTSLDPAVGVGVSTFHCHRLHFLRLRPSASVSRGEILLPLRIVLNCVGPQNGYLSGRALITEAEEIRDPIIVCHGKISRVHGDRGIGELQRLPFILQDHHAHRP
jgi:hypothetical protein